MLSLRPNWPAPRGSSFKLEGRGQLDAQRVGNVPVLEGVDAEGCRSSRQGISQSVVVNRFKRAAYWWATACTQGLT
jgi:hypothetical protein